jgi:hypothetical protein
MWILFGTEHNTIEGEPFVYFIGVFDDLEKANKERIEFAANSKECYPDDFFIKKVEMNVAHTYEFSWEESGRINMRKNRTLEDLKWEVLKKFHKIYNYGNK